MIPQPRSVSVKSSSFGARQAAIDDRAWAELHCWNAGAPASADRVFGRRGVAPLAGQGFRGSARFGAGSLQRWPRYEEGPRGQGLVHVAVLTWLAFQALVRRWCAAGESGKPAAWRSRPREDVGEPANLQALRCRSACGPASQEPLGRGLGLLASHHDRPTGRSAVRVDSAGPAVIHRIASCRVESRRFVLRDVRGQNPLDGAGSAHGALVEYEGGSNLPFPHVSLVPRFLSFLASCCSSPFPCFSVFLPFLTLGATKHTGFYKGQAINFEARSTEYPTDTAHCSPCKVQS